jgi:transcriptional regulator with XRE-family HTH domain
METKKELLGARLRELRKAKGLTQDKLAELVDIEQKHVSRIELGKSYPTIDRLERLADALSVSVAVFFDPAINSPFALSGEEKRVIEAFRSLQDASVREGFLKVIEAAVKK